MTKVTNFIKQIKLKNIVQVLFLKTQSRVLLIGTTINTCKAKALIAESVTQSVIFSST